MKATVYTLGCKVNSCDSGTIIELLRSCGIQTDEDGTEADFYIVNTCAVTAESERKSRNLISKLKRMSPDAYVIACGCWSRIEKNKDTFTQADLILNTLSPKDTAEKILSFIGEKTDNSDIAICDSAIFSAFSDTKTRVSIKIQDGCNRFCSYCLIPYLRGNLASESPENIINTVNKLCEAGYKEIILTGIHIASYDFSGVGLGDIIRQIGERTAIKRLRLGSLEPGVIDDTFLNALSDTSAFCPHFHLSLQSGSDSVLSRMNRRYTTDEYARKCAMIRQVFPNACITTDIITGFPGESEDEFEQTKKFVRKIMFSHVHVFPYSRREGTKACGYPNQLTNAVKHDRARKLIALSDELALEVKKRFIGKRLSVLAENKDSGENYYEGYSENYLRVRFKACTDCVNEVSEVLIEEVKDGFLYGIEID